MKSANGMGPCARMRSASCNCRGVGGRWAAPPVPGGRSCVLPLRIAGKHLNHVIVQAVVKLALECPWKLFIFNFAGLEQKLVGVHLDTRGLKPDLDFDAISGRMRAKIKQGMLVAHQFALDFLQEFVHGATEHEQRPYAPRCGARTLPGRQIAAFQDEAATGSPASSSPRSFISAITFSKAPSALASKSTK